MSQILPYETRSTVPFVLMTDSPADRGNGGAKMVATAGAGAGGTNREFGKMIAQGRHVTPSIESNPMTACTRIGIQRFLEAAEESKKDNISSKIESLKPLSYKVEMHKNAADREDGHRAGPARREPWGIIGPSLTVGSCPPLGYWLCELFVRVRDLSFVVGPSLNECANTPVKWIQPQLPLVRCYHETGL